MMKIALCKSHFAGPVSGADETLVAYATWLHQAGYSVKVVLLHPYARNDQYYKRLHKAGIEVSCILEHSFIYTMLRVVRELSFSLFFFLFLVQRAPKQMRKVWQIAMNWVSLICFKECRAYFAANAPDMLHVFTPDTGAALIIRAGHELNIPVLYHELGTPDYLPAMDVYYRRLAKVLPLCSEVAALSPILAAQWQRKFSFLDSLSVLPLIVDHSTEHSTSFHRPATEGIIFGYAARMEEGKGPLNLLDAFAEVKEMGKPVYLRMAGAGPQLLEVKLRAKRLGLLDSCVFTGAYTEPLGRNVFMQSLDVFVLPTLAEGTPNSIIEAMAHGLPIIASAVGGIPDMISMDIGILVPPGDNAALAQAMQQLADDPCLREQMGYAAKARYQEFFSPEAVLPVLTQTYQRVACCPALMSPAIDTISTLHPWQTPA